MFCLSGVGSAVSCEVFPPYDLTNGDYVIGLVDLSTFNSIPNIEKGVNDVFYFGDDTDNNNKNKRTPIRFEEGSYEIEDIEKYLLARLQGSGVKLSLKANNNTLKSEIECSETIDFTKSDSIGAILGFGAVVLKANEKSTSTLPVNILKVNSIRVECNIVRGTFSNGAEGHVLHEFYPTVPPGYKIVEIPNTIIYLPINVQRIHNITVALKDQDGNSINLRNETVSLRLHVKRIDGPQSAIDHGISI